MGDFGFDSSLITEPLSESGGYGGVGFSNVASSLSDVLRGGGASAPYSPPDVADGGTNGGGFWGALSNAGSAARSGVNTFGDLAKAVLPAAQVGAAGYGIASGIQAGGQQARQTKIAEGAAKRQGEIAGQAQSVAGPVADFGREQLRRAGMGEVPPAIRASIDQWKQGAIQRINQQAAATGQAGSSQHQQWLMWVDQNAQAMEASALADMERTGIQASGTAGQILGVGGNVAQGAGQTAASQQGSMGSLIEQANKALAALSAGAR